MQMKTIGLDVYEVQDHIPNLHRTDIVRLKTGVHETVRKRTRLCTHKGGTDRLHEMFVTYVKETYVRPNKHIGKDESLHILEGSADFVFFDDKGNITDIVPLGSYQSDRPFYCRIPAAVYHTWVIHSEVLVVHEATPGPFDRKDTIFAEWSPKEDDPNAVEYMRQLSERAAMFLTARTTNVAGA